MSKNAVQNMNFEVQKMNLEVQAMNLEVQKMNLEVQQQLNFLGLSRKPTKIATKAA